MKAARMFSFEGIHNLQKTNNVKLTVLLTVYRIAISDFDIFDFDPKKQNFEFSKIVDYLIQNFQ